MVLKTSFLPNHILLQGPCYKNTPLHIILFPSLTIPKPCLLSSTPTLPFTLLVCKHLFSLQNLNYHLREAFLTTIPPAHQSLPPLIQPLGSHTGLNSVSLLITHCKAINLSLLLLPLSALSTFKVRLVSVISVSLCLGHVGHEPPFMKQRLNPALG